MTAVTFERSIDEQATVLFQYPASATDQIPRHRPRRNVQHVDAEHCGKRPASDPGPVRIQEINSLRRFQIFKTRLCAPGGDAFQMRVKYVARPPIEMPGATRKLHRMLAGTAADLQDVAGPRRQEIRHRRPDRFVIAVESWTVQPAIGRGWIGISPVLDDESDHGCEAEGVAKRNKAWPFARVKASFRSRNSRITSPLESAAF